MTTTVIIQSPKPNHQRVNVQLQYIGAEGVPAGPPVPATVLNDGESTVAYVHAGAQIIISEAPREAPREEPTEA